MSEHIQIIHITSVHINDVPGSVAPMSTNIPRPGQSVEVIAGRHAGKVGVIDFVDTVWLWLCLAPNGEQVRVKRTSVEVYSVSTFTCDTCYDTEVIDQGGAEVPCPDCQAVEVKLTGLSHGAGFYAVNYTTAVAHSSSTITFRAPSKGAILADARRVRDAQVGIAKRQGLTGRNHVSSWAIALHERVYKALQS